MDIVTCNQALKQLSDQLLNQHISRSEYQLRQRALIDEYSHVGERSSVEVTSPVKSRAKAPVVVTMAFISVALVVLVGVLFLTQRV